jgi:hypothetical protein
MPVKKQLMSKLLGDVGPITILNNSQSAQSTATNPVHHRRIKYIDVRINAIRGMLEDRKVTLVYISPAKMVSGALTKALPGPNTSSVSQDLNLSKC